MALTTLLEIVTQACDEMGITRPTTVFGSSLLQDRQMLGLLNAAGVDLMKSHQWSTLIATASVTIATASSSYSLPTDFDRMLDDTSWDRTNQFKMMGGITPQKQQYWLSSGFVAPTTRKEFSLTVRIGANTIYINPPPVSADSLHFLYVRSSWVVSGSSFAARFSADTDMTVFDGNLMVKELKWRWRSAKGLAATDLIAERNALNDKLMAADIAAPPLNMGGLASLDPIDHLIPDGNWLDIV